MPSNGAISNDSPDQPAAGLAKEMTPHYGLPAWLLSLVLHLTILIALGMTIRVVPRSAIAEPDRSAGIVLVRQQDQRREYFDGESAGVPQLAAAASEIGREDALPKIDDSFNDFSAVLPGVDEVIGADAGEGLPGAADLASGTTGSKQIGGSVQTSVFGASGIGSKFVYVFDRSGSMAGHGGRPLLAAKAELTDSLRVLDRIHQFQIIFYNERPRVFNPTGGTPRLVWGDQSGKELAGRFVRGIIANGGTRHLDALKLALGMQPDVIFFLTDADEPHLTPDELFRIRQWNRGSMINAIEFGYGPRSSGDNFLMRLARQNHGQHAYVDISLLPRGR